MKAKATFTLILCAFFWGVSGVLTQIALRDFTVFQLILLRFLIASLLSVIIFKAHLTLNWINVKHGIILSSFLLIIYYSSTEGLKYTSASNAGFIIGSTVLLVPLFNYFFFKKSLSRTEKLTVLLCFVGLGLVTLKGNHPLNKGDFFLLIDAIAYSCYIIYNNHLKSADTKSIITLQYIGVMLMMFVLSFPETYGHISLNAIISMVILGVFCTFLAFYFQLEAQKYLSPSYTGQVLTLIPVFTVMTDFVFFKNIMTLPAIIGGLLIIFSTFITNIGEIKES